VGQISYRYLSLFAAAFLVLGLAFDDKTDSIRDESGSSEYLSLIPSEFHEDFQENESGLQKLHQDIASEPVVLPHDAQLPVPPAPGTW
jgi:hypothetical protein